MKLTSTNDKFLFVLIVVITIHALFSYIKLIYDIRNLYRFRNKNLHNSVTNFQNIIHSRTFRMWIISCEMMIIAAYFSLFFIAPDNTDETDISVRIENISSDLSIASSELSLIQKELESRIETVETLKSEAEIAENMISLSAEQVNAVQAKFHQELDANSGKSLLQNILISSIFFLLGLFVQPTLHIIKNKIIKSTDNDMIISESDSYSNEEIEQAIKLLDTLKNQ